MNEHSRRTFLIGTGAAAAVGTAAATGAVPAVTAAGARDNRAPEQTPNVGADSNAEGQVVAYVSDATSGRVTVMRGEDEVVLTDHDLARRLTGEVR